MMTGLLFHHQQQKLQVLEENMSNLTSASGEASVSSENRGEVGYFAVPPAQTQPVKRKRNPPGNPDPDAEVIALSPKTLMSTNRFMCEICGKGFQRDQNLQLHRRGHNLPWKLKQRTSKEVRKKVYVCPEPSCVHHDPSRVLGDLTGIKKHFFRKHGEKKWKCEKCSKKYAVQSDWKAHSKTCGTREYRCDCGTIFSRRDSFITHRAFCDALAEESARANPLEPPGAAAQLNPQDIRAFSLKKEQQSYTSVRPEIPPWLVTQLMLGTNLGPPQKIDLSPSSSSIFSPTFDYHQEFTQAHYHDLSLQENPNPSLPPFHPTTAVPSPHMSATALLQKAAQMGTTMSTKTSSSSAVATTATPAAVGFGLNLAPLQHMRNSLPSAAGFDSVSFDDISFSGIFNSKASGGFIDEPFSKTTTPAETTRSDRNDPETTGGTSNSQGKCLTRDFLGLRTISHGGILNIAGFNNCINTPMNNNATKPRKHRKVR
ncbi:Protein indeterminate-domain 2 [Hibiscus syriacus]|uniref:Protein indeterminate-domain 2 n=1 Tax=Hibiscus syriacus TaxID=106335 RepID=A0A6A2WFR6_HIBSY|nr:protein indeterminate-domain 7-like [Hibiscus syriacus]KAE8657493.1 Protein indeterminate-domain 2 [Hibiscus syriacus]